jgi:hypothetical protein
MARPLIRARNILHPSFGFFNPGACMPEWRWFWHLCIFAEPLWGAKDAGPWDYAQWIPPTSFGGGNTYDIGPRGWRRKWSTAGGNGDYLYANNGSTGSTTAPPGYFQPNDASVFWVMEIGAASTGDHILAWEGDSGDDGTVNANSNMSLSFQTTRAVNAFHESGTGTNNSGQSSNNYYALNTRASFAVVRTKATKTYEWFKNGVTFSSGNYTNDPALGNKMYLDIGDRNNVDALIDSGFIECVYAFKCAISPAMIAQLDRDPWGPFRATYGTSPAAGGGGAGTIKRSFCAGMIG